MDLVSLQKELFESWRDENGSSNQTKDLLEWIQGKNNETRADLKTTSILYSGYWFYDEKKSIITNKNKSFFSIVGIRGAFHNGVSFEQPIILQNEIGYLGIICKEIDGKFQLLMQAKIEPGNVNNVQISPTLQATESNFTQKHGGRKPNYLDYFVNSNNYFVLYDGKEPEQCARFLGKFNRNVIILVEGDVPVLPDFRWMSIGQIKYLADAYPNLVNMDTRTVLSCFPFALVGEPVAYTPLLRSIFCDDNSDVLFNQLLEYRKREKFSRSIVRLDDLASWERTDSVIRCRKDYPFEIRFFDISIQGREVTHWTQPLAVAKGKAFFGLLIVDINGTLAFLIRIKEELGCFDVANFGPTIQMECTELNDKGRDCIESLFFEKMRDSKKVLVDTILSEEGGRFYHEENRNVVLEINAKDLPKNLPDGYFLASYKTLYQLIAKYHCLNIQLRDLMSLLGGEIL